MSSAERFFALKISLVMAVRMLGLFMLFPVMSVYAGDYESATPFLIGMAIGIYGSLKLYFKSLLVTSQIGLAESQFC